MRNLLQQIHDLLPSWAADWFDVVVPLVQVAFIAFGAWLLMRVVQRLLRRIAANYSLPARIDQLAMRIVGFVVYGGALLWSLERFGVSGPVLWTAFTGFATVAAVAFFAAWSVLSNLFCAILIYTTRAFRIGEVIELLENADKPGVKGMVAEISLVHTTLYEEHDGGARTMLQIPNSLFFQKPLRRWNISP